MKRKQTGHVFSRGGLSLQASAPGVIEIDGRTLIPDEDSAYVEFKISHGFTAKHPTVTAYGSAMHPGTVANSYRSMRNKPFNLEHKMKFRSSDRDPAPLRRDWIMGALAEVEFPATPGGGWRVDMDLAEPPGIRVAAVLFKKAEKVGAVLREHLTGLRKWTVSQEIAYDLFESGFMVMGNPARREDVDLVQGVTPDEFKRARLGYVGWDDAPEELATCFDEEAGAVTKGWNGTPVVLLKGGINGRVHYEGAGIVRYGAEREAEIQRMLASDPQAVERLLEEEVEPLAQWVEGFLEEAKELVQ